MSLGLESGIISGIPTVALIRTEFIVSASNTGGSCSAAFNLTVNLCQYGNRFVVEGGSNDCVISLRKGYDIIAYGFVNDDLFCIPYDKYDYLIKCPVNDMEHTNLIQIKDSKGRSFKRIRVSEDGTATGTVDFNEKSAPIGSVIPSILATEHNRRETFAIDIMGVYDTIIISPPFPDNIKYNSKSMEYSGKFMNKGVTKYTIVVSGPGGKVEILFTVAVDECPVGMISLEQNFLIVKGELLIHDSTSNIIQKLSGGGKHRLCLMEGDDTTILLSSTSYTDLRSRSMTLQDNYNVIARYIIPFDKLSAEYHLTIHSYVPERSTLKYSRMISSNWNSLMFDDSAWKEARVGGWGSFDKLTTTLYFRKHFSVHLPLILNDVKIDVILQDRCIAYLNGKKVFINESPQGLLAPTVSRHRFFVAMSYLQDGDNVLSIELHRVASTPIESVINFDVFIQGDFPRCTPHSHEVIASQYPVTISASDPSLPFSDSDGSWVSSNLPATLIATFNDSRSEVINWITMKFSDDGYLPIEWRVEGVRDDKTVDILCMTNSTSYNQVDGSVSIQLNNERAYRSIQFVFIRALRNRRTIVYSIEMYSCNCMTCDTMWRNNGKKTDDVIYGKCPITRVGVNKLVCSTEGNKPKWISSGCERIHPPQGKAYIDTYLRFNGISMGQWLKVGKEKTVQSELMQIMERNLKIDKEETSFLSVKDVSTTLQSAIEVFMRFTVVNEIGDYVLMKELALMDSLTMLLREALHKEFPIGPVDFLIKPVLHKPVKIVLIFVISVIIVVSAIIIVVYLYIRSKKSNPQKTSKTEVKGSIRKAPLLSSESSI